MKGIFFALILVTPTISCAIGAKWPHENFKKTYSYQIGKNADDPSTSLARYPQKIGGRRVLPNGNTEIEYIHTSAKHRLGECRVFFEIDPETRVILGWRYEGTEESCVLPP